jgi:hypothetical protein
MMSSDSQQIKVSHQRNFAERKKEFERRSSQPEQPEEAPTRLNRKPTIPIHDTVGRARFAMSKVNAEYGDGVRKRRESEPIPRGHVRIPTAFRDAEKLKKESSTVEKVKMEGNDLEMELDLWRAQVAKEFEERQLAVSKNSDECSEGAEKADSSQSSDEARIDEGSESGYEAEKDKSLESSAEAKKSEGLESGDESLEESKPFAGYVGTDKRESQIKLKKHHTVKSVFGVPLGQKEESKEEESEESFDDLRKAAAEVNFSISHSRNPSSSSH